MKLIVDDLRNGARPGPEERRRASGTFGQNLLGLMQIESGKVENFLLELVDVDFLLV